MEGYSSAYVTTALRSDQMAIHEPTTGRRRADATRNDERIIEVALATLGTNPAAGMEDIAKAAGVGRTTLHRRYKTREQLIAALRTRARRDVRQIVRTSNLADGTATEALDRLLRNLVDQSRVYAFLAHNPAPTGHHSDRIVARELAALVRRGQVDGDFATTNPPEWWVEVIQALLALTLDPPPATAHLDRRDLIHTTLTGSLITTPPPAH
jgi:TetR/AcrR family transcriptional regulator, mexCD-oprJ operon repressor